MTPDEKLARINVKIERADKHIIELENAINAFFQSGPYTIVEQKDPNTGQVVAGEVTRCEDIPLPIATIVGDAFQNLRSSLDHLAHQLWLMCPGANPDVWANFPFWNEPAKFKKAIANGKVERMRQDAIDVLAIIEPCKGLKGNQLWALNRLNNVDKHRLLLTVGTGWYGDLNLLAALKTHSVLPEQFAKMFEGFGQIFLRAADPEGSRPLKVGDILPIRAEHLELNQNQRFRFSITLWEPEIAKPQPVLETIKQLSGFVKNTLPMFKHCLV
jgi:hypothetical protein